ncbi:MAG TPA: hypothetical protein DDW76_23450 [Cyanobacteria bacterium UBA11369]|nr:hypothetical protein [Cyanobacteria bacterium UBA11371]HBE33839.1 hypothetical protein [Cyanobacteria bacterium UBA11368]HBE51649.1 hypothetical protein [Cyanobacteria bacterium UBA11369]
MTFSRRQGYDPNQPKDPILEDAPEWLRIYYIKKVLNHLTFVDDDFRYRNSDRRPLGIKSLHENFCVLIREDTKGTYDDSSYCWEELTSHLRQCPWYQFYDFVELAGREVKEAEQSNEFEDEWIARFGFEAYRQSINQLFAENQVGWRLDKESQLGRPVPEVLIKNLEKAESDLKDDFEPARNHYKKAYRYLYEHPLDPENSIKEIVSAVESVAKTMFPKAKTLGDGIKEMRSHKFYSSMLLSMIDKMIEKFYGSASSEPGVRHGASVSSRVDRIDAELWFHTGVAIIRYLIDRRNMSNEESNN